MIKTKSRSAFTIVELIVVIAVIAILAGVVLVSYGAWRTSVVTSSLKSDLVHAASAMESSRTFDNAYPMTIPTTFSASSDNTITLTLPDTKSFCIDGITTQSASIQYYIDNLTQSNGATKGTCTSRAVTSAPSAPASATFVSATGSQISLSWPVSTGATSYTAQCARDATYIVGLQQTSSTSTVGSTVTASVGGLNPTTTYYCQVNAKNSVGSSAWSPTIAVATDIYQSPAGLAFTGITSTSIALSWSNNSDAISYTIQCATNSSFTMDLISQSIVAPTLTASFTGLANNVTYYCRLNVVYSNSTSVWSASINAKTTNYYGSLAVGSSIEGYWTTMPQGYVSEDGSAVSRTNYADLFAVIGTTYGAGDGSTTFNLPDSRGLTTVNRLSGDTYFGTIGQKSGLKTVTLTVPQIPLHTHVQLVGKIDDSNFTGYQIAGQYPPSDGPGLYNNGTITGGTGGNGAHNNIQPSIVRRFAIKYSLIDTTAPEQVAGSSIHGYWSAAPTGYILEDGAAVSRTTYASLFTAIGTTYGAGDGSTTFNLPDSRGRAGVNFKSGDAQFGLLNQKYGEENHLLTTSELPSHSHLVPIGQIDDKNWTGYNTGSNQYSPSDAGSVYNTGKTTGSTGSGGSSSFSVVQPSMTQLSAIKYTAATGDTTIESGTSLAGYWATAPAGYLVENGAVVSRTTYADLFAVIGTTYGAGDGSTTFNLPDSRGRLGVNLSPTDAEFNTIGETYGEKAHTLTILEMPIHTHTLTQGTIDDSNFTGYGGGQYPPSDGPGAFNTGILTTSTGGGQAFNIIQPSIVKLFVIKS